VFFLRAEYPRKVSLAMTLKKESANSWATFIPGLKNSKFPIFNNTIRWKVLLKKITV